MTPHLTAETLQRYRRRELAEDEVAGVLRHLGECDVCRGAVAADIDSEVLEVRDGLWSDPADAVHLDAESQIIPYVDGALSAAEASIVESHIEDCPSCRAEVEDLVAFSRTQRRTPARWAIPASVAAGLAVAATLLLTRDDTTPQRPVTVTTSTAKPAPRVNPPAQRPAYENPEWEQLVRETLSTGRLPFPRDLATLRGIDDTFRGTGDAPRAELWPYGVVIDDVRPVFTWPARAGATYIVTLFDGDEQIARSDALPVARWTPPRDLRRGRTYEWQVRVEAAGESTILPRAPAPAAMFRVVSEDDHRDIVAAKRTNDPLLLAVLLARSGLRDEAIEALRKADRTPEIERLLKASEP